MYIEHFHSIIQRNLNGTTQQKSFELLREHSLLIEIRRRVFNVYNATTGKSTDGKRESEIRKQITRFGENGSEKAWVEHVALKILYPIFQKLKYTSINEPIMKEFLGVFRPLELCRLNNMPKAFSAFVKVSYNALVFVDIGVI